MKTIAIVQARMGSTRLPGKVLADVHGKPLLWHVVHRLKLAAKVDVIVVSTPDAARDTEIAAACSPWDVEIRPVCYRPPSDVLGRYRDVAEFYGDPGDLIVRITADCPLVDPDVVDATIALVQGGRSWASNVSPRTWPDGLDVEVLTYERLMALDRMTTDPAQREHVTPQLYAPEQLHGEGGSLRCPVDLHDLRWTIDTPADLEWFRGLMARTPWDASWQQILFGGHANRRAA